MLTKGIVEEIVDQYTIKVRLPIYDKLAESMQSTSIEDLAEAIICTIPNITNTLSINDIVIVGFEDDDISKPIILGQLYRNKESDSIANLKLGELTTISTTKLNYNTFIGNITPNEIETLSGAKDNLQRQIDLLNDEIQQLKGGK